MLEKYPISNVTVDSIPLFSRSLGLRFRLEKSHFTQNDRVELRCSARIADLAVRETTALITNAAGPINDGLQAQNRVNRSSKPNWTTIISPAIKFARALQLIIRHEAQISIPSFGYVQFFYSKIFQSSLEKNFNDFLRMLVFFYIYSRSSNKRRI